MGKISDVVGSRVETLTLPTATFTGFTGQLHAALSDLFTIFNYFPARFYDDSEEYWRGDPDEEEPDNIEEYHRTRYVTVEIFKSQHHIRQQYAEQASYRELRLADSGVDYGEELPENDRFWGRLVVVMRVYNAMGFKPGIVIRAYDCGEPEYFRDLIALLKEPPATILSIISVEELHVATELAQQITHIEAAPLCLHDDAYASILSEIDLDSDESVAKGIRRLQDEHKLPRNQIAKLVHRSRVAVQKLCENYGIARLYPPGYGPKRPAPVSRKSDINDI